MIDAEFGRCQEAALGCDPFYIPCNRPAVALLKWSGRSDRPIRVCVLCLDHNVKNRGGEVIRVVDDWAKDGC